MFDKNTMERLPVLLTYKKGHFPTQDEKWEKHKRMQVFTGLAWDEALNQEEVDTLYEIWKKKRLKPYQLTFEEVSTFVKLADKISDYRYRVTLENTRLRMHRSRKRLKEAVEAGDPSAVERFEVIKKSNRVNMSEKRSRKRNGPSSS